MKGVRDIKNEYERKESLSKQERCFYVFMGLHRNWLEGCCTDTSKSEGVKCLDDTQVCVFTMSPFGF